jgi:hypothetical protein
LNPNGENIMTTTTVKTNGLAEAASLLATAMIVSPKGKPVEKPAKGSKKAGPKEQQLAAMRMPTDGSVPAFLDRTKGLTKEQIAASGDKARENAERGIAKGVARGLTSPAPRASNLTDADKKVIAELTKADAAKATPPAPKRAVGDRARYDWNGAREAAEKGKIPVAPDFSANTHRSYRGMLAEVEALVKAKDLNGLVAFRIKGSSSSRNAVKKYREIAIVALKAKKV